MSNLNSFNQNIDTQTMAKLIASQSEFFNAIDFTSLLRSADKTSKSLSKLAVKLSVVQESYLNSYAFKQVSELSRTLAKAHINFLSSDSHSNITNSIVRLQKILQKNHYTFDSYITKYQKYISGIANNLSSYDVQINTSVENLIRSVIDQVESSHSVRDQSLLEPLNNIVDITKIALATEDIQDEGQLIQKLIDFFSFQIAQAPKTSDAIRNCFNHFFIIFIFILQTHLSNAAQLELLSQMEYQHAIVLSELSELKEQINTQETAYSFYLNKKQSVNLIDKPSFKEGNVVCQLYPGQRVRLVDNKGEWVKIEFFSFITNQNYSGWHKKKYFKRIKQ